MFQRTLTLAVLLCGVVALSACSSGPKSRRIDPDVDDSIGGTGIDSGDVRAVTERMARSILEIEQIAAAATAPIIVVEPIKNGTAFPIDTDIFLVRMRAQLLKHARGKVQFVARDQLEAILAERKAKAEGTFTSSGSDTLRGADYILTGNLLSVTKAGRSERSDYILYSFRLIDAENSLTVWEDIAEVKKEGQKGILYR
ncbi:MAG: penicillin-binding protein activator LpoB [Planctomycetota bacterium]